MLTPSTSSTLATSSAMRSSSSVTWPRCSREVAISASSADSVARSRDRDASSLTTTAVTRNTASENQLLESARVNV